MRRDGILREPPQVTREAKGLGRQTSVTVKIKSVCQHDSNPVLSGRKGLAAVEPVNWRTRMWEFPVCRDRHRTRVLPSGQKGETGGWVMEPRGSILLVYFVADESGSMGRNIGELNEGLAALHDALQRESFAAAKVRFSVIGFSDTAFTYLEPADLRVLQGMPTLTAQSLTSYASAFDQLNYRISVDIPSLKAQGYTVHRPAVFFLTDGLPSGHEDWRAARTRLLAQSAAPNILAFGIGDADPATIIELATRHNFAFVAARGVDTGAAISEFVTSLTQSVISSGQAAAAGTAQLQFERPEGFTLAVDVV